MMLLVAICAASALSAASTDSDGSTLIDVAFPGGLPDGAQVVDSDTVEFEDGAVVLELGDLGYSDCPSGWLCLWEDEDYGGRMLQFQSTGYWQNLTDYGFNDEMSSWRNRRANDSKWAWNTGGGGTVRCMDSGSSSSYVGSGDNDEASSIRNFLNDSQC